MVEDAAAPQRYLISCAEKFVPGVLLVWEAQQLVRDEADRPACGLVELAVWPETQRPNGGSEKDFS